MNKIHNNRSLIPPSSKQLNKQKTVESNKFKDLLKNKLDTNKLKFSKHAQKRIDKRDIEFNQQELERLNQAVAKARDKGALESLVMTKDNAYIVSVENDTVITAMSEDAVEDNVFTNIDSAVIMK